MACPRPEWNSSPIRLNRFLALCGCGSRRQCERFIREGRVRVNGATVSELAVRIVPGRDRVELDGRLMRLPRFRYYVFFKPRNVICTMRDPEGRPCVGDYIGRACPGVFPAGRLDRETEGLLLLTNDGALAEKLLHPRYGVPRVYLVGLDRPLSDDEIARMQQGLLCDGERLKAGGLRLEKQGGGQWVYRVTLHEGKNRHIRRMMSQVGTKVLWLRRIGLASVNLEGMVPGQIRELTSAEVERLRTAVDSVRRPGAAARRG